MRRRRHNPLIRFADADVAALAAYRGVPSIKTVKKAAVKGEAAPTGKPVLSELATRAADVLAGSASRVYRHFGKKSGRWFPAPASRTGRTFVSRAEMRTLDSALGRGLSLSSAAEQEIRSRIERRKKREWWNIVDDTKSTKYERSTKKKKDLKVDPTVVDQGFAATYAPPQTCPSDCGMRGVRPVATKDGGWKLPKNVDDPHSRLCYAGEHNALQQWKSLWKGYTGLPWKGFLEKLRKTPAKIVRVNIAGDLPADMSDCSRRHLDRKRVIELAKAASANGRSAFTYTHFDPTYRDNGAIIKSAIDHGLQVNLSADNLRDADRKVDLGFDVAVVLPHISYKDASGRSLMIGQGSGITTPKGRRIFFCPNITTGHVKRKVMRLRVKKREQQLRRKLNAAEKAQIAFILKYGRAASKRIRSLAPIGKTCATCTKGGPECAVRGRERIIGFPLHGGMGAAKRLDLSRADELFFAPNLKAIAASELSNAIRRTIRVRQSEARKKKKLLVLPPMPGFDAWASKQSNPKKKRRRVAVRRRRRRGAR